jgi:hypothetical protein
MKTKSASILVAVAIAMVFSINLFSQDKTTTNKQVVMKRFLVERTFPAGLIIPINEEGSKMCLSVVSNNAEDNVTWIHSYVTKDKKKTYCIYDAPSEAAIRKSAKANGLPVDNVIEVSVLDPYFYK